MWCEDLTLSNLCSGTDKLADPVGIRNRGCEKSDM